MKNYGTKEKILAVLFSLYFVGMIAGVMRAYNRGDMWTREVKILDQYEIWCMNEKPD